MTQMYELAQKAALSEEGRHDLAAIGKLADEYKAGSTTALRFVVQAGLILANAESRRTVRHG